MKTPSMQEIQEDWLGLNEYIERNYPKAQGKTLYDRVTNALETMDVELGQLSYLKERTQI